jgi:hypothetical protein
MCEYSKAAAEFAKLQADHSKRSWDSIGIDFNTDPLEETMSLSIAILTKEVGETALIATWDLIERMKDGTISANDALNAMTDVMEVNA